MLTGVYICAAGVCRGLTMPSEHTFRVYYILTSVGIQNSVRSIRDGFLGPKWGTSRRRIPRFFHMP